MELDATLVGVIIGSALSFMGQFIGLWFSSRQEEMRWTRQQKAEEILRKVEEEKKAKSERAEYLETLRKLYHKIIQSLSIFVSRQYEENYSAEKWQLLGEIIESITLLSLYKRDNYDEGDNSYRSTLENFIQNPTSVGADFLLDRMIYLAINDTELFPTGKKVNINDPGVRRFQLQINKEHRKQQFIKGYDLPPAHLFMCNISKLSPSQLDKIWSAYAENSGRLEKNIILSIPTFNRKTQSIDLNGQLWDANINPVVINAEDIFNAWEIDYEQALSEAKEKATEYTQTNVKIM